MNREIVKTNKYKKDIKKVSQWKNFNEEEFNAVVEKIRSGGSIDKRYRPHPMTNQKLYHGCMNLHFKGDILLMYKIERNELILDRIGSHSQLLGNERNNRKG